MEPQGIGSALIDWFRVHHRILPWREQSTVYSRLVSEFMLQQTQVATVLPYFKRWIEACPTLEALARASQNEVLKLWEGLGYYARARNLHKTAKILLEKTPQNVQEWEKLPGIGHYTASALASITQNHPIAVVDGNVIRVLCRLNAITQTFKDKNQALQIITHLAQQYLPPHQSGVYNEAIMELGALICKPSTPICSKCPIARACLGYQQQLDLPQIPKFQKVVYIKKQIERILVINDQGILLHQATTPRLHQIYELPKREDGIVAPENPIGKILRSIAKERITELIFKAKNIPEQQNLTYIPLNELHRYTLSGPHRKWLNKYLQESQHWHPHGESNPGFQNENLTS